MLLTRAVAGLIFLFAVLTTLFFGLAGTLHAGRAWAALAVFFGCAGLITVWLWFQDKPLLERRVKAGPGREADPVQNILQGLAALVFLAAFAIPGLDIRLHWSRLPLPLSLAGDGMIAIGFLIVFLTFRANSYAAGTIEIAAAQPVIARGPYAVLRHPMYAGTLVMILGIPLALGSGWGLIPAGLLIPVLIWRLLREEAFLLANLPGYAEYRRHVRCRLVPLLW